MVVPPALVAPLRAAKHLADRHTAGLLQEVLADFIASGYFERFLRRARTQLAERRAAVLAALDEHLGGRVDVEGQNAGAHVLVWLRGVAARRLRRIVEQAAEAGVGLYPATPYYLEPPRQAAFVLGYAAIGVDRIDAGVRRLAAVLKASS